MVHDYALRSLLTSLRPSKRKFRPHRKRRKKNTKQHRRKKRKKKDQKKLIKRNTRPKGTSKNYPGKRPHSVCVSVSRKSRDLDALGSREVMVVMK